MKRTLVAILSATLVLIVALGCKGGGDAPLKVEGGYNSGGTAGGTPTVEGGTGGQAELGRATTPPIPGK
jgi:hypothetical protein